MDSAPGKGLESDWVQVVCQEEGLYNTGQALGLIFGKSTPPNAICEAEAILLCAHAQFKAVVNVDDPVVGMDSSGYE
jgi:hypothetical protein